MQRRVRTTRMYILYSCIYILTSFSAHQISSLTTLIWYLWWFKTQLGYKCTTSILFIHASIDQCIFHEGTEQRKEVCPRMHLLKSITWCHSMTFGGVGKSQKQPSWTPCLDSYDVTPGRPGVGTGQEDRRLRITEELMSAGGSRRNTGGWGGGTYFWIASTALKWDGMDFHRYSKDQRSASWSSGG